MKRILTLLILAWAAPAMAAQSAFLGVELDPAAEAGAKIRAVQEPSAASLMGLQAGDLIVGIDDFRVDSHQALIAGVGKRLPGEIVTVRVLRGAQELAIQGILGRRPGAPAEPAAPGLPGGWVQPMPAQPGFPYLFWREGDAPWQHLEMPQMPSFPELPFAESPWPGLEIWQEFPGWEQMPERLRQFPQLRGPSVPVPPGAGQMERHVELRYPGDTPEADRQALIEQAQADYGDDVVVRFEGEGTSVTIRQSSLMTEMHSDAPPTPPTPPAPDKDDEL